ncbi:MAG: gliding motility-associated C-terminal domain-containing protein [Bacteroidales bacterium]|nr:gliding motility-associated C-terminal domain-containing protein [Bacteroidales bacterium]
MRKLSFLILFLSIITQVFATHNRAGEITYRQISDLTFEITIITYTATGPGWTADRPQLEIQWGDNTTSTLPRVEKIDLPDNYRRNKYIGTHTYPGPGIYVIVVEDPNRNLGVNNIPNSVNTIFSISTTMLINPTLGINNTPILTQPPVDKAAVGQVFTHNPGAYDPDGDSLSYKLTICRAEDGNPIEGYSFPAASNSLTINEITGDLVWDAPVNAGIYNIAMLIEEWRKGIKIGQIIRDMQIEVYNTNNKPPVVNVTDICIEADSLLTFSLNASDPNNDIIVLSAHGSPFEISGSSASLNQTVSDPGYAEAEFSWQTECDYVRKQAYNVNIKAEDNSSPVSLVDIKSISISIVGPKVKNPNISATTNVISLIWDANYCTNVIGYNIYRRISPSGFEPDFCEVGVPEELGYSKIAFVEGYFNTSYDDYSVSQGHEYCYLITAVFPDEAEGYASDEVCATTIRGVPTITNVSVNSSDDTNGEIYVAWSKPTEIDIGEAPGPYQYVLYRSDGYLGENLTEIARLNNIDDTIFVDSGIDTYNLPWSYKVEFYNNQPENTFLIGTPHIASSIFIDFKQMENSLKINFNKNTPWVNSEYTIYRYSESLMVFDSIGTSNTESYIDKGLKNGIEYCYQVRSSGGYSIDGIINPIINFSQENCEEAIDTTPPCPPELSIKSVCDSVYFEIHWNYNDTCYNDVKEYRLYYSPYIEGEHQLIHKVNANSNSYLFYPDLGMAGCFYMTAVDSFNNESSISVRTCLDDCTYYELPNVFTPNADGIHDLFQPFFPYYFVEKINIQIFNRWGILLFETEDPDINWDGRNFKTGKIVSDGVYYYICDVYEQRLTGTEIRHLNGCIHVFNASDTKNMRE